MKQVRLLLFIIAVTVSVTVMAQTERAGSIVPKYLVNGYFFSEKPNLPEGSKTYTILRDDNGNRLIAIRLDADLPKSVIRQAIPMEQVHNAKQFLNEVNLMDRMIELTRPKTNSDGSLYSPSVGKSFPEFSETDMDGRTWTNADVRGHVMVLNLWYSGCGPCRAEMPELSTWKEQLPDVMFFSATFHDADEARIITDKHHFTWTHLVNVKGMMSWIGGEGFPLTIVVDKQGVVRYLVHGTSEVKRKELFAKIKEASEE